MSTAHLPQMPPLPAWHAQAACRGMSVDLFHPKPSTHVHTKKARDAIDASKAVCARCPVINECLAEAYTMSKKDDLATWSIRGGTTALERHPEEKDRRARSTREWHDRHKAAGE